MFGFRIWDAKEVREYNQHGTAEPSKMPPSLASLIANLVFIFERLCSETPALLHVHDDLHHISFSKRLHLTKVSHVQALPWLCEVLFILLSSISTP